MKVLVCGGRDYTDQVKVSQILDEWLKEHEDLVIIHGDARGADRCAKNWATVNKVPQHIYPARWAQHGSAAGPIRNRIMFDQTRPDVVIAFSGGKGTAHMLNLAHKDGGPLVLEM